MARRLVARLPRRGSVGRDPTKLCASEIDALVAIEGRPPGAGVQALMRGFGITEGAARSWMHRLRTRKWLRIVAIVDPTRCGSRVESVAYLRIDWSDPSTRDLEAALQDDPAVTEAALTFGPVDVIVYAAHENFYAAEAWSRGLQVHTCVRSCRVDRMRTQFKRAACVAAFLRPAVEQRRVETTTPEDAASVHKSLGQANPASPCS